MDGDKDILKKTGYNDTFSAAKTFAEETIAMCEKYRTVCKSTSDLWLKTFDAFEKSSIPIILANPMKVMAIAEAGIKTDKEPLHGASILTSTHSGRSPSIWHHRAYLCHVAPSAGRHGTRLILQCSAYRVSTWDF